VQLTILAPASTTVGGFTNEAHMTKSFKHVDYDKITVLEVRVRAIKGVDMYNLVQAIKMCLVPNMIVPKSFVYPNFIKYIGTQCPATHLKSYCNKMVEVMHDKKLLMQFFQDNLNGVTLSWYMRLDNT